MHVTNCTVCNCSYWEYSTEYSTEYIVYIAVWYKIQPVFRIDIILRNCAALSGD